MPVEAVKKTGSLKFEVSVSGHTVVADVSVDKGGTNSAPDPHDYLLASLASCTAITVQMFANRKGIPLESTDVRVAFVKEGVENEISREIQFYGKLSEEQRQLLLTIAEKCPIHRFLERGAKITSTLRSAGES
jgi:putative redox protein